MHQCSFAKPPSYESSSGGGGGTLRDGWRAERILVCLVPWCVRARARVHACVRACALACVGIPGSKGRVTIRIRPADPLSPSAAAHSNLVRKDKSWRTVLECVRACVCARTHHARARMRVRARARVRPCKVVHSEVYSTHGRHVCVGHSPSQDKAQRIVRARACRFRTSSQSG